MPVEKRGIAYIILSATQTAQDMDEKPEVQKPAGEKPQGDARKGGDCVQTPQTPQGARGRLRERLQAHVPPAKFIYTMFIIIGISMLNLLVLLILYMRHRSK